MNVVSDRLNCRARACIVASSRSVASSKTHSGLPASRDSAKTLTMRNRCVGMRTSRRFQRSAGPLLRSQFSELLGLIGELLLERAQTRFSRRDLIEIAVAGLDGALE